LSHGDFLDVSCDKDAWCATTSVFMLVLKNKLVMHVSSRSDSSICCLLYIPWVTLSSMICVI
jgi:hypothetical protein